MTFWDSGNETYRVVSPREAFDLSRGADGVFLLDVRTREEYNNELGHVEHAVLIPVDELEPRLEELEPHKGKPIIAICRSGIRSGRAAGILTRHGFSAMNMTGGMIRWNLEGLPVVRDKSL